MAELLLGVLAMGAGVFIASAFAKLSSRRAYGDYRAGLRATKLVPGRLLGFTAVTLAAVELVTAAALAGAAVVLVTGSPGAYPLAEVALAVAVALTAVLVTGVAVAVSRGVRAPCACFGGSPARPLGAAHLIRNTGLLALLALGLAASALVRTRPGAAGSILALAAGLVVALLVARWDDLVSLFAPVPPARAVTPASAGGHHGRGHPDKPGR